MSNTKQPHYNSLTPMRRRFVDEFIQNGGHQSKAYQAAGYSATKPASIRAGASNLRNRPDVSKAIKERVQPDEMKRLIDNKRIMEELKAIIFNKTTQILDKDGTHEATPTIADRINAINTYMKITPIEKEYLKEYEEKKAELELELMKSQIEMNNARIGMEGEEDDKIGQDILNLMNAFGEEDDASD